MRRALLVVLSAALACVSTERRSPCAEAEKVRDWARAAEVCRGEDSTRYARALFYMGRRDEAVVAATENLSGDDPGAAALILGNLAFGEGDLASALGYLTLALAAHATARDDPSLARDAQQLAGVLFLLKAYDRALAVIDVGRAAAERAGDRTVLGYLELARGDVLRTRGDIVGAERAFAAAFEALPARRDRAWVRLKQAVLHYADGEDAFAEAPLRDVLALAEPDQLRLVDAAHLGLAAIALHDERPADAEGWLAMIPQDRVDGLTEVTILYYRSRSLEIQGDVDGAAMLARRAEALPLSDDWTWYVPLRLGNAEMKRGDLDAASAAFERAIAKVEEARAISPSADAELVAAHREPYQNLIGARARQGRWGDALALVARLDAGDMLRSEAAARHPAWTPELAVQGLPADPFESRFSPDDRASAARESSRARVLVIALLGGERLWRIVLSEGELSGVDVMPKEAALALIDRAISDPGDAGAAVALEDALLVPGASHVLLIGPLARAPIAVAKRPVIRLLGLQPRRPRGRSGPALVIGDPTGDLPSAAEEARAVARRLEVEPAIGAARAALLDAEHPRIIHVAAHVGSDDEGPFLEMADGRLRPREIAALDLAGTELVVLAGCGSAAARDEEAWGSLAGAFLAAGADLVLATAWSVEDAAAAELVERFYEAGGAERPAEALAEAQRELAKTRPARQWAAFALLGRLP